MLIVIFNLGHWPRVIEDIPALPLKTFVNIVYSSQNAESILHHYRLFVDGLRFESYLSSMT